MQKYPFMYAAVGIHPDEVGSLNEERFQQMKRGYVSRRRLLQLEKSVLIITGIMNLMIYRKSGLSVSNLARELNLPVLMHSREAAADTMEIMKQYGQG